MKKIYKKPILTVEAFEFDSIMAGTETEEVLVNPSNLAAYINSANLVGNGGTINLGDNNTLQSINYKDFILK